MANTTHQRTPTSGLLDMERAIRAHQANLPSLVQHGRRQSTATITRFQLEGSDQRELQQQIHQIATQQRHSHIISFVVALIDYPLISQGTRPFQTQGTDSSKPRQNNEKSLKFQYHDFRSLSRLRSSEQTRQMQTPMTERWDYSLPSSSIAQP